MNITPFDVYLVMQLDSFFQLIIGLLVLCALLSVFCLMLGSIDSDFDLSKDTMDELKSKGKMFFFSALLLSIFATAIPSTKTAASMFLLPAIANNKEVQQLPEDLLKLVRGLVKEWTPKEDVKKEGK